MRDLRPRPARRRLAATTVVAALALAAPVAVDAREYPQAVRATLDDERPALPAGVSANLRRLFADRDRAPRTLAATAAEHGVRTAGGRVLVDIVLSGRGGDPARRIEAAGGTVRSVSRKHHRASVAVPDEASLARIAALPEVRHVQPAYGAFTRVGDVDSRAFEALNVDAIGPGTPENLTGAGQRIGILSDSFARTDGVVDGDTTTDGTPIGSNGNSSPVVLKDSKPQDSLDLPAEVELRRDDANDPLADEGAAMAELAHDLAPGAGISFYTAFNSFVDFAAGIDDLCGPAGATVVIDDVGYFRELMYQRDIVSRAAQECGESGVPYFSAAGNNADTAFHSVYRDVNGNDNNDNGSPAGLEGDFHDWDPAAGDPYLSITLDDGEGFTAVLQWNQPALSVPENGSNGPQIDLDLYVFPPSGTVPLRSSIDDQRANDPAAGFDPVEIVAYVNDTGSRRTVRLAIDHWAGSRDDIPQDDGTALEFRLVFFERGNPSYEYAPADATIYGHTVADGVISVGAVPWWEAPGFIPTQGSTSATDPEPFTSLGGSLQHHFRPDGTFFRRTLDPQPAVAAVDANNTTFFGRDSSNVPSIDGEPDGFPNFFGTSAAVPNAGAVAALLLEDDDTRVPADILARLGTSAFDVTGERAAPGCDAVTGSGLIDAEAALVTSDQPPAADAGADQQIKGGRDVTLDGSTSSDNNGIERFRWTQVAGPRASLSNPDGAQTDFEAPRIGGRLVFELRVTDAACLSDTDRVRIDVERRDGGGAVGWLVLFGLMAALCGRRNVKRSTASRGMIAS